MTDDERIQRVRASRVSFRTVLVAVSGIVFLASLTQDGFYIDRADADAWANCFGLLLVGWLGMFDGVFAWLANPMLVLAWAAIWFPRLRFASLIGALIALLFALSFLLHHDIMANEAGGRAAITGYGWGYWLWIGSMLVMACGGAVVAVIGGRATAESEVVVQQSAAGN